MQFIANQQWNCAYWACLYQLVMDSVLTHPISILFLNVSQCDAWSLGSYCFVILIMLYVYICIIENILMYYCIPIRQGRITQESAAEVLAWLFALGVLILCLEGQDSRGETPPWGLAGSLAQLQLFTLCIRANTHKHCHHHCVPGTETFQNWTLEQCLVDGNLGQCSHLLCCLSFFSLYRV